MCWSALFFGWGGGRHGVFSCHKLQKTTNQMDKKAHGKHQGFVFVGAKIHSRGDATGFNFDNNKSSIAELWQRRSFEPGLFDFIVSNNFVEERQCIIRPQLLVYSDLRHWTFTTDNGHVLDPVKDHLVDLWAKYHSYHIEWDVPEFTTGKLAILVSDNSVFPLGKGMWFWLPPTSTVRDVRRLLIKHKEAPLGGQMWHSPDEQLQCSEIRDKAFEPLEDSQALSELPQSRKTIRMYSRFSDRLKKPEEQKKKRKSPQKQKQNSKVSSEDQAGICIICTTIKATVLLLPCCHLCMCENCCPVQNKWEKPCPMCRGDVKDQKRVFLT